MSSKRRVERERGILSRMVRARQEFFEVGSELSEEDNAALLDSRRLRSNTTAGVDQCIVSCSNCKRTNVLVHEVLWTAVVGFRRQFCFVKKPEIGYSIVLCEDCETYVTNTSKDRPLVDDCVWPSFIWNLLSRYGREVAVQVWLMLPSEWRVWWEMSVRDEYDCFDFHLPTDVVTVVGTDVWVQCQSTLSLNDTAKDVMKDCSWVEFINCFENGLTIPTVRCPWGCCEYPAKARLIPLDWLFQFYIGVKVLTYSASKNWSRLCCLGFRSDFFNEPVCIAGKKCCPTVVMKEGVPFFLCCRYHSASDWLNYIHVPRNPTGSCAVPGDDANADIVVVPRTIRMFKRKGYSNSYGVRRVCGSYNGIDSMNLSRVHSGAIGHNIVSHRRHLLSLVGRDVIEDDCSVSIIGSAVDPFDLDESRCMLRRTDKERLINANGLGGTYVSLEDVYKVQKKIKECPNRLVWTKKENDSQELVDIQVTYSPSWSSLSIPVVQFGSPVGRRFPCSCFQMKEVDGWRLSIVFYAFNMIAMIPELWDAVDVAVTSSLQWYGWVLQYLSSDVFLHRRSVKRYCGYPFYVEKKKGQAPNVAERLKAVSVFGDSTWKSCSNFVESMKCAFSGVDNVLTFASGDELGEVPPLCQVLLIVYDIDSVDSCNINPLTLVEGFELRFLGCADEDDNLVIFARNKGCSGMWRYERAKNASLKWCSIPQCSGRRFLYSRRRDWRVLAFVRHERLDHEEMRNELLRLQGGQHVVRCARHGEYPLVVLPVTGGTGEFSLLCHEVDCGEKQYYGCVVDECNVGLCHEHLKGYLSNNNEVEGRKIYIGRTLNSVLLENEGEHLTQARSSSSVDDESDDSSWNSESGSLGGSDHPQCKSTESVESGTDDDSWTTEMSSCSTEDLLLDDLLKFVDDSSISDEEDGSGDDSEDCSTGDVIPVTNAAKQNIRYNVHELLKDGKAIPHHILLNGHGNCLVRRAGSVKPNKAARHFLQRLACVHTNKSMPLLYPEGSIFPSIFWISSKDGAAVGSLPCCALMDNRTLAGMGIASLYDHCRTRLLDPSLLCSTSFNYQSFMWDLVANLGLRGSSAELVFRRGFADYIEKEGLKVSSEDPKLYDFQQIDSRKTVNQLAAASARNRNQLFFTWTLNAKETPGVRVISKWCHSQKSVSEFESSFFSNMFRDSPSFSKRFDTHERLMMRDAIEEGYGSLVIRTWMEFIEQFLCYLQYGAESPFRNVAGGVKHVWNRAEIQSDKDGKAPHCHTMIYMRNPPQTEEDELEICNLIRGGRETFVSPSDIRWLKASGVLEKFDSVCSFCDDAELKLTHDCTRRCIVTRTVRDGNGNVRKQLERKCKGADNRSMNPYPVCHCFIPVDIKHDINALEIMEEVGMVHLEEDLFSTRVFYMPTKEFDDRLKACRHCPSCYETGRIFSPANPVLYGMLFSAMNLQFVTAYILIRYLVKYCASVDKGNRLGFKVSREGEPRAVDVINREAPNTKITSNAIDHRKQQKKDYRGGVIDGRALSQAEVVMQFLQYPAVITSFDFDEIPTQPMGMRTTLRVPSSRIKKLEGIFAPIGAHDIQDLNVPLIFAGYAARRQLCFPSWRQYDVYQMMTYADSLFQPTSVDKVSLFSLRPPELSFIRSLPKYHVWFKRFPNTDKECPRNDPHTQALYFQAKLKQTYEECPWYDGFGSIVKVRYAALSKIVHLLENYNPAYIVPDFGTDEYYEEVKHFFGFMADASGTRGAVQRREELYKIFVTDVEKEECPIYWFRSARSNQTETFLYHVMLSMGSFKSEYELCSQGSMRQALVHCRLIEKQEDMEERKHQVKRLMKKYCDQQLCYYPLGSRSFDREIVTTFNTLKRLVVYDQLYSQDMPSALYTRLRDECDEESQTYLTKCRENLVRSFCNHLTLAAGNVNLIPDCEAVIQATFDNPIQFDPTRVPRSHIMTDTSFREHEQGRTVVKEAIDKYKACSSDRAKSVLFVGAGGVGKTIDLRLAGIYACCQGLNVMSTTLTGKRAAEIAGEHIHVRFRIPVNETLSAAQMADQAYISLLKDPKRMIALKRLDVLLIDELGQIESKLLSALDYLMRKIRRTSHWMGGILVIATMDVKQLKSVSGVPPIFSPCMLSTFRFVELKVSLRTQDEIHMRIQELTRLTIAEKLAPGVKEEFFRLAGGEGGYQFVESFTSPEVPTGPGVIHCYPKHEKCIETERRILNELLRSSAVSYPTRDCEDFEETRTQINASVASDPVQDFLDLKSGTSRRLVFHPYAAFTVTYNDREGSFFNGQICMLLDELPSQDSLDQWEEIEVYRAPIGLDELPRLPYTHDSLISQGWVKIRVGRDPCRKKLHMGLNGSRAFRDQYGLRHRIATTIHYIMGSTVETLITRVDNIGSSGLWEAAMVVVLLSRTRRARDLYFVGNKHRTLEILWSSLLKGGQFADASEMILRGLLGTNRGSEAVLRMPFAPSLQRFYPHDIMLPREGDFVVYMLVSVNHPECTYIGHTSRLRARINQHNSSLGGSRGTGGAHKHLAPFGLYAYVKGFDTKSEAASFEGMWKKEAQQSQIASGGRLSCEEIFSSAFRFLADGLSLVDCGHVRRL